MAARFVRLLGIGCLLARVVGAQEGPATQAASARAWTPDVRLEQVRATATIVDGTATTEVEQVFRNSSRVEREEVFLLPLPEDTVVSDLSMTIDGKVVKGELLDRGEARGVYEGIVRARRDPALLEWVGRSCVRLSAFPVPPNGEARVTVRYASVLSLVGGAFEFRLPLALGPVARGALKSLVLDATLEFSKPLGAIYSPTHPVEVRRSGERSARVTMEASGVAADRDLRLLLSLAREEIGLLFLAHRRAGEEGTFLALLSPRLDLAPGRVLPKDVVFVLDTSGSMAGEKMEQAKKALRHALERLNPGDRFRLIRFATEAEAFREGAVGGTPENLEAARTWIAALEARGGTNLEDALLRAVAVPKEEGRIPMVFFLTDGLPTVGNVGEGPLVADILKRNEARARIFVFGVGDDVNARLLDTLAEETRAAREYVRPGEEIDVKVSALVDKVSNPVLSDPTFAFEGAETRDAYPKRLPDLFKGSPLVVVGRFRGEGPARVRLRGRFGDGDREWNYAVDLPKVEERNDTIRATWASRKVGFLLDEIRLHGENPELVEEVKRLAREHGLVTPYTSFLVWEEARRLRGARVGAVTQPAGSRGAGTPGTPGSSTPGPSAGGGSDPAAEPAEIIDRKAIPKLADNDLVPTRASQDLGEESDANGSSARLGHFGKATTGEKAVDESLDARDLKTGATVLGVPTLSRSFGTGWGTPAGGRQGTRLMGGAAGGVAVARGQRSVDPVELSIRRVGGKVLHLVDSVWIDSAFTEKDREKVVPVAFLSDEYFALLAREPGLAPIFALGERVLVEWKGTFYEVK